MQRHRRRAGAEEDGAAPEPDLDGRAAFRDVDEESQEAAPAQSVEEAARRAPGGEDLQPAALPRPDDHPVEGDRAELPHHRGQGQPMGERHGRRHVPVTEVGQAEDAGAVLLPRLVDVVVAVDRMQAVDRVHLQAVSPDHVQAGAVVLAVGRAGPNAGGARAECWDRPAGAGPRRRQPVPGGSCTRLQAIASEARNRRHPSAWVILAIPPQSRRRAVAGGSWLGIGAPTETATGEINRWPDSPPSPRSLTRAGWPDLVSMASPPVTWLGGLDHTEGGRGPKV